MIVRYNSLNRFEKPVFTLCQPGSTYNNGLLTKTIGALVDHEAEEIVFNFNALSELNVRVNLIPREDTEENDYVYGLFEAIENRRLIYAEDIGYFVITNVSDDYNNGVRYKDVSAKSVDAELQQKMIPYIADGTYRFSTDSIGKNKGLLESIVESLPLWTIGYVDASVADKWRTFEDVDTSLNCLSFLINNVQDAYECIVVFDIIHRIINVYSQDNYVRQTDIHISKHDLINSIDVDENADDIYTAINALGNDTVSIAAVNPTGTNVIYAFNHYLSWMPEQLRKKVTAWQDEIDTVFEEHYRLSRTYYQYLTSSVDLNQEIEKLNTQITMYSRCRDNIVAQSSTNIVGQYNPVIQENGGTEISSNKSVNATLREIDSLISECRRSLEDIESMIGSTDESLAEKKNAIDAIHDRLNIFNYFTEEEYTELCLYIYEGEYKDEYVIITESMSYKERFEQMKLLYDRAKSQLDKVSVPTQEFNIDVESFIFMKEFEEWSEQLETGCLINVELDINDIAAIFLASITVNYDDRSMKLTFGNRYNRFDPKSLFDNMLGNISKSANTLGYIKDAIYPIKNGEFSAIREVLQTSRDLTMHAALAATNEEVIIDASGYTGKKLLSNGEYDDRQVKIVSNSIVFTEDGWDSCSLALGEIILDDNTTVYGINANVIFGDMIIGGGLKIYDKDGNELLSVVDDIRGRVSDAENNIHDFALTATGLMSRIDTAEGNIVTLQNDAKGFSSSIKSANNQISSLWNTVDGFGSRVDTVEGNVSEMWNDVSGFGGRITTAEGNIIALRATVDGIDMTGVVKFADLSQQNSKTVIHGGNIKTGTIESSNYISGTSGTSINLTNGVIDTANFKVSSNGLITATGGTIGGWTLSSNLYGYQLTSGTPGSSGFIGLYTAYDTDENYRLRIGTKFSVDNQGNLTSNGGKIGGLTISGNGLSKTEAGDIGIAETVETMTLSTSTQYGLHFRTELFNSDILPDETILSEVYYTSHGIDMVRNFIVGENANRVYFANILVGAHTYSIFLDIPNMSVKAVERFFDDV